MRLRHTFVVGLATLLVAVSWQVAPGAVSPGPQQGGSAPAAPDFTLTAYSGGRTVSLDDIKGKVALLYFFFPS